MKIETSMRFSSSPELDAQRNKPGSFPELTESDRYSIEELKKPVEDIINELRPEIEKGCYSLIIADDASGRIPALMAGLAIKEIYERKGFSPPLFRPIAGSDQIEDPSAVSKKTDFVAGQIRKTRKTFTDLGRTLDKVLIVTDVIARGRSIDLLSEALKRNDLRFDVATIGFQGKSITELERKWGSRIILASRDVPYIYRPTKLGGGKELSGVKKNDPSPFAVSNEGDEVKLRSVRKLVKEIAHEIATKYLTKRFQDSV